MIPHKGVSSSSRGAKMICKNMWQELLPGCRKDKVLLSLYQKLKATREEMPNKNQAAFKWDDVFDYSDGVLQWKN